MTDNEIEIFIERMGEFGDVWEAENVRRVYGDMSLEEALADRGKDMALFVKGMIALINAKSPETNNKRLE